MNAQALHTQTYLPNDADRLADVLSFLAAHERKRGVAVEPRYALVGADEHERIEVPASVHRVLVQVVAALQAGKAVTVAPQSLTLTTQQAADLLGVSRPTIVRLITGGVLPAERVGNRNRLRLDDVLAYREVRRTRQYEALAAADFDLSADDDSDKVHEQIRAARKALARQRERGNVI